MLNIQKLRHEDNFSGQFCKPNSERDKLNKSDVYKRGTSLEPFNEQNVCGCRQCLVRLQSE